MAKRKSKPRKLKKVKEEIKTEVTEESPKYRYCIKAPVTSLRGSLCGITRNPLRFQFLSGLEAGMSSLPTCVKCEELSDEG